MNKAKFLFLQTGFLLKYATTSNSCYYCSLFSLHVLQIESTCGIVFIQLLVLLLQMGDKLTVGILKYLVVKSVSTAARNSTIKTVGKAAVDIIAANSHKPTVKESAVVKNGMLYLKPTRSSDDYIGADAYEIVQELLGAGFENITLKPVHTLSARGIKKYGKIVDITINGKDTFAGVRRIPCSSKIVIEHLDFKNSVDQSVYNQVQRLHPETVHSFSDLKGATKRQTTPTNTKKFCPYCGTPIENQKAKFCTACGEEI